MNQHQKNLLEKMKMKRIKASKLIAEAEEFRKQVIKEGCDHSINSPYKWEHDNGYGKQTKIDGFRCDVCGALDSWGTGKFWDPGYGN
jgi:hypothetical protein